MATFIGSGHWWLPGTPEKAVAGTVSFSPGEGAKLELIGTFREPDKLHDFTVRNSISAIHGFIDGGRQVTLFDCLEGTTNVHVPSNLTHSTYSSSLMFVGGHFDSAAAAPLESLSISYVGMESWARLAQQDFPHEEKTEGGKLISCRYSIPNDISYSFDEFNLSFGIRVQHSVAPNRLRIHIEETAHVMIEPKQAISFYLIWQRYAYHVQNFLTLAMGVPAVPDKIRATSPCQVVEYPDGSRQETDIEVFHTFRPHVALDTEPPTHRDILFYLPEVRNDFGTYFRNWLEKASLLGPVYDLFFGTRYNSSMYLQHQFLSLVQAIEAFHRRTKPGSYSDGEAWEAIKGQLAAAIPSGLPKEFKESLKQKFKYLHEYSLRKRLKAILARVSSFAELFGWTEDGFIGRIVDTRNYLTHYDAELLERAAKGPALWELVQNLHLLIETCLLLELGMPEAHVKSVLVRRQQLQGLMPIEVAGTG